MKILEIIQEGGWTTGDNPGIKPSAVKVGIELVKKFLSDFNPWLESQGVDAVRGIGKVTPGHPTGSAAYHDKDPETVTYGDMDMQIIIPDYPEYDNLTSGQVQGRWATLIDKFIQSSNLPYIEKSESRGGQPMFKLPDGSKMQVDLMPHPVKTAEWGRFRATGEHGLKGLLNGNIFAVMSELLPFNLQHKGIQYKTINGQKVNYSKTLKGYDLHTVGTDIKRWILDIFLQLARDQRIENPIIDPLLKSNPGVNVNDVKTERLVNGIKGFAASCDHNKMWGNGDLKDFQSGQDFLNKFIENYKLKAEHAIANKKRDKATTADSQARAQHDREAFAQGLDYILKLFGGHISNKSYKDYRGQ